MNSHDKNCLSLTAKQRLAISRQALLAASKQTWAQSVKRLVSQSFLMYLESRELKDVDSAAPNKEKIAKSTKKN
jgi:hypothetical protein